MIRDLWKRFNTSMVGYWVPTFLTVLSTALVLSVGIFVDKIFFLFAVIFIPLLILMWISAWSWGHPQTRYGQVVWPFDDN